MTKLLTQNSKMKKSGLGNIYNFGIPAFKSSTGLMTCPMAKACAVGCYARSGAYLFSNVAKAYEYRLAQTLKADFKDQIQTEINKLVKKHKTVMIRIHDSGDFYNVEYVKKWFEIMQSNPSVSFYAYTKMITLFESLKPELPSNFKLIYSYGGKEDAKIKATDRHSKVFETIEALKASGYVDTSSDDLMALGSNPKIGLVYHGNKNFENTSWNKVG